MIPLHQRLALYSSNESYTFVPSDSLGSPTLTISRATGDINLNKPNEPLPSNARRLNHKVYGILGLISLSLGEYIIVVTGREIRGRLMGNDVYCATEFEILPLNPDTNVHHPPHPVESHLLGLVRSHLNGSLLFFSYGWDLTRRLQAQWETQETDKDIGFWEVADDRFFWNKFLQSRLIEHTVNTKQDLSSYILPVLYGTFDIRPVFLHGRHIQLCLISRRSRFRAGTRYFRRGIDHEGHVANFNETEQMLFIEAPQASSPRSPGSPDTFLSQMSFVQIRGSVPVFWAEVNTLRYKPDLQIMDLQTTADALRAHLQEQSGLYGSQTLVNLVNQKGHEKPVKEAYERYVSALGTPNVKYEYFDFHNECKNMRWDRISVLIDRVEEDLLKQGYFHCDYGNNAPTKLQQGVVRTNCMDNLDRTNVVQASLAKWTLTQQLRSVGILPEDASIDDYEALSKDYREMWADNGDLVSKAYAGSGALKSDFTRTNKRTRKGLLEDGLKSVLRYLKNNYFDGARQDAFDLVTGSWIPRASPSASLFLVTDGRPLVTRSMPAVASFSLFMICAGLTLPRTSDYSLFYYFLLWLTLFALSIVFIVLNGIDYVSWPRLLPLSDVIYYEGPGFRSAHHGKGIGKFKPANLAAKAQWAPSHGRGTSRMEEIETGTKKRVD